MWQRAEGWKKTICLSFQWWTFIDRLYRNLGKNQSAYPCKNLLICVFKEYMSIQPRRHRTLIERTEDVQKTSRTSPELLMYVQFTSCVYGVYFFICTFLYFFTLILKHFRPLSFYYFSSLAIIMCWLKWCTLICQAVQSSCTICTFSPKEIIHMICLDCYWHLATIVSTCCVMWLCYII